MTSRDDAGVSTGSFRAANLATHVGDDPAAVAHNRALLAGRIGVGEDHLVWMEQVHGSAVAVVDGPRDLPVPAVDGLVTATAGLALAVLVADCAPVLLAEPRGGVVAAVHAGRRGLQAGIIEAALAAMARLGAVVEDVTAWIGPTICAGCYEVPAALRDDVAARVPAARARTRAGTPAVDIPAGLWAQLRAAGVGSVTVDPRCPAEDGSLYSYRRDAATGRFAGVIWCPLPAAGSR